jgi:hypothetical protein
VQLEFCLEKKRKNEKHQLEYQNLKKSHSSRLGHFGVLGVSELVGSFSD